MGKVRIQDVANRAGVSTATVSHVLNNTRQVSPTTASKVLQAVSDMHYTPNFAARGFRTGKQNTVAFVVPDISNRFFSVLIEIIEAGLSKYGYHLVIANTKECEEKELEHLQYFVSGMVDGIILASTFHDCEQLKASLPSNFPLVLVDRLPKNLCWDSVTISSCRAIQDGVSFLCAKGHRRIGFISGLAHLSTTTERLEAYKTSLQQNGIEICDDLIVCGSSTGESAGLCTQKLLDNSCSAIVVCNGLLTYDTQQYLWEHGYTIGKDIDIVGFKDEYRLSADNQLILQPVEELGQRAVEQIINRIEVKDSPVREIVLNSVFISK